MGSEHTIDGERFPMEVNHITFVTIVLTLVFLKITLLQLLVTLAKQLQIQQHSKIDINQE